MMKTWEGQGHKSGRRRPKESENSATGVRDVGPGSKNSGRWKDGSERGADEDGGGPECGGWSLIKMFFN